MPRGHVPFCLTRSFLFVTMRTINVLEWLVLLVGPFTTFLILNCSSILFLSYNVSPRSSSNRSVLKSPRITIFENFVHIFSFNFGNAVKNSLFWFGGRYIVPTWMSLESAFNLLAYISLPLVRFPSPVGGLLSAICNNTVYHTAPALSASSDEIVTFNVYFSVDDFTVQERFCYSKYVEMA